MPISPNDPDYKEIMDLVRQRIEEQKAKVPKRPSLRTPPGYCDPLVEKDREYNRKYRAKKKAERREE